jgi:hypothetical protein
MCLIFFSLLHKNWKLEEWSQYSDWLWAGWPRCWNSSLGGDSPLHSVQAGSGPNQSPVQCVPGVLSPEVKWLEHEADHSPQSAEVENIWIYTSIPLYIFKAYA